jgi:hypothetical protein
MGLSPTELQFHFAPLTSDDDAGQWGSKCRQPLSVTQIVKNRLQAVVVLGD